MKRIEIIDENYFKNNKVSLHIFADGGGLRFKSYCKDGDRGIIFTLQTMMRHHKQFETLILLTAETYEITKDILPTGVLIDFKNQN